LFSSNEGYERFISLSLLNGLSNLPQEAIPQEATACNRNQQSILIVSRQVGNDALLQILAENCILEIDVYSNDVDFNR
jgi:hypothetical protein